MRVSREKAAEHRRRILEAAARLFRERGIGATGVDSITEDAGLTHGAVYSQFGSKEAIAIEAIRLALHDSRRAWQRSAERKGGRKIFTSIVQDYLSRRHRDAPGRGCLIAALGGDISRQPDSVREAFTKELKEELEYLTAMLRADDDSIKSDDVLAGLAAMAGALMLSRAVRDEMLSDRILNATARLITSHPRPARGRRATA